MRESFLNDLGLRGVAEPNLLEEGWFDCFEGSQHVWVVMSISDIVEKCSDVFLHFDYALGAAYVCFSVVLEALRFGEELGGFVRLEGLESIHSQSKLLYQRGSKLKAK